MEKIFFKEVIKKLKFSLKNIQDSCKHLGIENPLCSVIGHLLIIEKMLRKVLQEMLLNNFIKLNDCKL